MPPKARSDKALISIVAPVFQGAAYIAEFYARMTAALAVAGHSYELIIVNDGSTDGTSAILLELHGKDPHLAVINLSRNFGQMAATRIGLAHATGDYVYMTDSDLEEAPEWFGSYFAQMQETGTGIVYGTQDQVTPQTWLERLGANTMRFILKYFSDIPMVDNYVTARLMRRPYVNALLQFSERTGGLYILCQLAGFTQASVTVSKGYKGSSSYTTRRKMSLFIDHIISGTGFPVACILWLSALVLAVSADWGFSWAISLKAHGAAEWALWSIWCIGGLLLAGIGIVGLYASRILVETKRRPLAIVESILEIKGSKK